MLSSINVEYYAQLFSTDTTRVNTVASMVHSVLGAAHGYRVVCMMGSRFCARQLVFSSLQDPAFNGLYAARSSTRGLHTAIHRLWTLLFSRDGFFGVESGYFDISFVVQEAIEIISQTSQVYSSSLLITKDWINAMYIAIIVLNCWSTPLIKQFMRRSTSLERLMCLLTDAFLNAGTCMLMPLIIFAPYWRDFDLARYGFDTQLIYNGMWFMNMVNEGRQIFASDEIDLLFKIIPHVSIFSSLSSVKAWFVSVAITNQRLHARMNQHLQLYQHQHHLEEINVSVGINRQHHSAYVGCVGMALGSFTSYSSYGALWSWFCTGWRFTRPRHLPVVVVNKFCDHGADRETIVLDL